ncbi:DNA (cytosine-5-)-methyltransferase [Cellulomonas sp. CW35]|uniref:DNA (cytosine-5-)-methyltransferase n=1 Tax=Cellulomonas sp. CW35 TaxID=3458249 RepID=UPI0040343672
MSQVGSGQGFTFVDLFAGIGGFHAGLHGLGGRCVYAAELDDAARAIYTKAWIDPLPEAQRFPFAKDVNVAAPLLPEGVTDDHAGDDVDVPDHDVLAAGFPCQAFSKSGRQRGVLDEVRGTLFYNVLRIIRAKQPKVVFLENVRNLVGPRHRETTFATIVRSLGEFGYTVSQDPTIISPHRIHPDHGGTPQVRDRVYILAIRSDLLDSVETTEFPGFDYGTWDPSGWQIDQTPLALYGGRPAVERNAKVPPRFRIGADSPERALLDTFQRFLVEHMKTSGMRPGDGVRRLPGFPLWFRHQGMPDDEFDVEVAAARSAGYEWKVEFLEKNRDFFLKNHETVVPLLDAIKEFPESRKKLEWQAKDAASLWDCLIQLRPSGIRVKPLTYAPALVAINQAPVYGPGKRRITPGEAARLQGFPDAVIDLLEQQDDKHSYKQLGNAVHVGAVRLALAQFLAHHEPALTEAAARDAAVRALVDGTRSARGALHGVANPGPEQLALAIDEPARVAVA